MRKSGPADLASKNRFKVDLSDRINDSLTNWIWGALKKGVYFVVGGGGFFLFVCFVFFVFLAAPASL